MTPHDLIAALGRGETDHDSGSGDAPSADNSARHRELARYRDDPDAAWRRHPVANDATVARLARDAPNMSAAVEVARRCAILSCHVGTLLRLPP